MSNHEDSYYRTVGHRIRDAITSRKTTYESLSDKCMDIFPSRISVQSISRITQGRQRPYIHQAMAIARALDVDPYVLYAIGDLDDRSRNNDREMIMRIVDRIGDQEALRRLLMDT